MHACMHATCHMPHLRTVRISQTIDHIPAGRSSWGGNTGSDRTARSTRPTTQRLACVKVNPELERASAELAGIIADLTGAQADAQENRDAAAAGAGDGAAPLLLTSTADAGATAASPPAGDAGTAGTAATATEVRAASPMVQAGAMAAGGERAQGGAGEDEEAEDSELELQVDSGDDDLETSEDEEESEDDDSGGGEDEETQFHLDQVRGCRVTLVDLRDGGPAEAIAEPIMSFSPLH